MKTSRRLMIIVFVLIVLSVLGFGQTTDIQTTTVQTTDLIGPSADCTGKGLPPQSHIQRFESVAWNSGGKTLRQIIIEESLAQGVHPALVAAHASKESGMGQNACHHAGKSSLTGCSWPGGSCRTGCSYEPNCVNDETQIKCTARVDRRAYIAATGGAPYSVYGRCVDYKHNEEILWRCILCSYVLGTLGGLTCPYYDDILDFYCKWANYLGDDYQVRKPTETHHDLEIPEDSSGAYQIMPSVNIETEGLMDYEGIIAQSKELMQKMSSCDIYKDTGETTTQTSNPYYSSDYPAHALPTGFKKQVTNLDACLDKHIPQNWEIDCENIDDEENNIYLFCVPLNYEVKIYNSEKNKVEDTEVKLKFALEFEVKERGYAVYQKCSDLEGYGGEYSRYRCVYEMQCEDYNIDPNILPGLIEIEPTPQNPPNSWTATKISPSCDQPQICCEYTYYII